MTDERAISSEEQAIAIAIQGQRRLGADSVIRVIRKIRAEGNSMDRLIDKGDDWTFNIYDDS